MITLPSWESSRPAPTPKTASAIANPALVRARRRSSPSRSDRRDDERERARPARRASGRSRAASLGPGERRDEHRHRHREQPLAGLERVQAEHDLQVDGQHEERPEQDRAAASAASSGRRAAARSAAASGRAACRGPARSRRSSHSANAPRQPSPARMRNGTTEKPNGVISVAADRQRAARLDPAPLAALEDPEDDEPEPERRERDADEVELRRGARRAARPAAGGARAGSRRRSRSRRRTRSAS